MKKTWLGIKKIGIGQIFDNPHINKESTFVVGV